MDWSNSHVMCTCVLYTVLFVDGIHKITMKRTLSLLIIILALSSCSSRSRDRYEQQRVTIKYEYKIVTSGYIYYTNEYTMCDNLITFKAVKAGEVSDFTVSIYTLEYIQHYE